MPFSAKTQQRWMIILKVMLAACWLLFFQAPMVLFAAVRFDNLMPIAIALLAVCVGYTSLVYNRARAHPRDRIGRRSLKAADCAFLGTLLLLFTIVVGVSVGSALLSAGYHAKPVPSGILDTTNVEPLPVLAALFLLGPAQFAALNFYVSLRVLVRRDLIWGTNRRWDLRHRRVA